MSMKTVLLVTGCCVSLVALSACGGGDEGPPRNSAFPNISWRIDPDLAQIATGGQALKDLKSGEIALTLARIAKVADTQVSTGLYSSDGTGTIRVPVTCRQSICTSGVETRTLGALALTLAEYEPVMTVHGVKFSQFRASLSPGDAAWTLVDSVGYTGWLKHSFFALSVRSHFDGDRSDGSNLNHAVGYSVGKASGEKPTSGKAVWSGSMIGMPNGPFAALNDVIQGEATVRVDLKDDTADVSFTKIARIEDSKSVSEMQWSALAIKDGAFGDSTLQGRFYGENHEEVGGVFERSDYLGTFGAAR